MENAKKMILIDPEVIERLKKDNSQSHADNNLSRLDEEMQQVLNKKINDREKWSLYLQTLQRFWYFVGKDRKPLEIPIFSNEMIEYPKPDIVKSENILHSTETYPQKDVGQTNANYTITSHANYSITSQILTLLPKTYKQRGELLMKFILKNNDKIRWDKNGVVFINNEKVENTNIIDLFNDISRPLKNSSPNGWWKFSKALRELGVPISYIGNPKRIQFIKLNGSPLDTSQMSETHTPDEFDSPTSDEFDGPTPGYSTPISNDNSTIKKRRKIDWQKWTP